MAVLDTENRRRIWAHAMREWFAGVGMPAVTKSELRAAVDATDQWIDDNQDSYNAALPQPFRSSASTVQKTLLFCLVAMRRGGRLPTKED